jgi:enoyl-CoA hydratase
MDLKNVKIEKEGSIATVFIDRPKALNALNSETLKDLKTAISDIKCDDNIKIVIISGSGDKAFVAGADIKEMENMSPLEAREFLLFGQHVFNEFENLEKPIIAAINGFALGGGCELALACDIIIASSDAKLGLPEVSLGLHPGFGGTQRLPRLVGKAKAKELIFTADMIGADEALKIGLVNRVVPKEKLMEEAIGMANKILSRGSVAIKLAKAAINVGTETSLEKGLAYEAETGSLTFSTQDKKEGMKAFLEKRKPNFVGK